MFRLRAALKYIFKTVFTWNTPFCILEWDYEILPEQKSYVLILEKTKTPKPYYWDPRSFSFLILKTCQLIKKLFSNSDPENASWNNYHRVPHTKGRISAAPFCRLQGFLAINKLISFHNRQDTEMESTATITADLTLQIFQAYSITAFLLTQTERVTIE